MQMVPIHPVGGTPHRYQAQDSDLLHRSYMDRMKPLPMPYTPCVINLRVDLPREIRLLPKSFACGRAQQRAGIG